MSINWNDYDFEPIEPLDTWNPPSYGGIYAITYIRDPVNNPKTHTILYFGETGNFPNASMEATKNMTAGNATVMERICTSASTGMTLKIPEKPRRKN